VALRDTITDLKAQAYHVNALQKQLADELFVLESLLEALEEAV
jgi:hypothetical protein